MDKYNPLEELGNNFFVSAGPSAAFNKSSVVRGGDDYAHFAALEHAYAAPMATMQDSLRRK